MAPGAPLQRHAKLGKMICPISDQTPIASLIAMMIEPVFAGREDGKAMVFMTASDECGAQPAMFVDDTVAEGEANHVDEEREQAFDVRAGEDDMLHTRRSAADRAGRLIDYPARHAEDEMRKSEDEAKSALEAYALASNHHPRAHLEQMAGGAG